MKRLGFIGYLKDPSKPLEYYSGSSISGNKMQLGFLRGISKLAKVGLIISVPPIASFPTDRRIFVRSHVYNLPMVGAVHEVGFINLPIIKQLLQMLYVIYHLIRCIKMYDVVITFNSFPQVGIPPVVSKAFFNKRFVAIVADYPLEYRSDRGSLNKIVHDIFRKLAIYSINHASKLILLNENVKNIHPNAEILVINGGVCTEDLERVCIIVKKPIILYSGALTEYSGVIELINSFKASNIKDMDLHVYGSGPLENHVKIMSNGCGSIKYMGVVSNREILDVQSESMILVNPRLPMNKISNMTFPSKLFEYFMSGTTVLSTNIGSIDKEYCGLYFKLNDVTAKDLKLAVDMIMSTPEEILRKKAMEAYLKTWKIKSWDKQSREIYEFI